MGIDPLTAGIGAVGTVLGGLLGSQPQTSTTSQAPWSVQQPFLKAGMQDAAGIYAAQRGTPYFQGNTYAAMDPHTAAALQGIYGYTPQGTANANAVTNTGVGMVGAGANGINTAASNLSSFRGNDPTQQNIANAGLYANNPYLNGAIDAASRDVTRNLSEVTLPGIARGADANGNLNSSRTGIAEGIALRGAQDQIGNIASTMRANAWNNGLNLSQQGWSQNQSDYLNAMAQAGALSGNQFNAGMAGVQNGQGLYYDNLDAAAKAGQLAQADQQGLDTQAFQRWQGNLQQPWTLLGNYQNAITGAGTYPSSTASAGGGIGGALQGALGGGASALGLYGAYKNLNPATTPTYSWNGTSAASRNGF